VCEVKKDLVMVLVMEVTIPATFVWTPAVGLVMVLCNIGAIALGKIALKYPSQGPELPNPKYFGGMSLWSLIACTSLGHLLGIGAIQGFASIGWL
jgi:photosystem I subunit 10